MRLQKTALIMATALFLSISANAAQSGEQGKMQDKDRMQKDKMWGQTYDKMSEKDRMSMMDKLTADEKSTIVSKMTAKEHMSAMKGTGKMADGKMSDGRMSDGKMMSDSEHSAMMGRMSMQEKADLFDRMPTETRMMMMRQHSTMSKDKSKTPNN